MPGSSVSVGHKELGIALRERGIIGNVFNKLESVTKIKREVFIYIVSVILALLFLMNYCGSKMVDFITTVWPVIGSLRAMDKQCAESQQKWLGYWILYAAVNTVHFVFVKLEKKVKRIYILKLLILVACALPIPQCGAIIVYNKVLSNKVYKEDSVAAAAENVADKVAEKVASVASTTGAASTPGAAKDQTAPTTPAKAGGVMGKNKAAKMPDTENEVKKPPPKKEGESSVSKPKKKK